MDAPLPVSYTNEVSAEYLRTLDRSPFTKQQLAKFNQNVLERYHQKQTYYERHPPIGIYRWGTTGSQTRNGGVIQQASTQIEITLNNGQQVRVAQVGDHAVYADGSTAQIVTGAGQDNDHVALVGSRLSNGDEIINTPQDRASYLLRDGVSMAKDFLPSIEGMPHG